MLDIKDVLLLANVHALNPLKIGLISNGGTLACEVCYTT